MEFDLETFKNRLREAFGEDSQETVGKKIGVGQGNVSKLVSSSSPQLPRADTLFRIAEEYNVSIDWLLGVSEKEQITRNATVSYASAVRAPEGLCQHQTAAITDESGPGLSFKFDDPLIKFLVRKSLVLSTSDTESYQKWLETRLAASEEWGWLQIHGEATKQEGEYAEMMGIAEGPFFKK